MDTLFLGVPVFICGDLFLFLIPPHPCSLRRRRLAPYSASRLDKPAERDFFARLVRHSFFLLLLVSCVLRFLRLLPLFLIRCVVSSFVFFPISYTAISPFIVPRGVSCPFLSTPESPVRPQDLLFFLQALPVVLVGLPIAGLLF